RPVRCRCSLLSEHRAEARLHPRTPQLPEAGFAVRPVLDLPARKGLSLEWKGNRLAMSGAREAAVRSSIGREHGVDDDAGDRDVEPNRKSESGQAPVRGKAAAERKEKSNENHRQGHDRQTDVRDE